MIHRFFSVVPIGKIKTCRFLFCGISIGTFFFFFFFFSSSLSFSPPSSKMGAFVNQLEIHPNEAKFLGVKEFDFVKVVSESSFVIGLFRVIFQTPTTTNQPPQLSLPLWATNILTQHKKERKKEKEREEKERESGWLQEKESGEFIFLSPLGEEFLGEGEKEGEREGGNGVVLEVEVCGTDLEKCFSSSQLGTSDCPPCIEKMIQRAIKRQLRGSLICTNSFIPLLISTHNLPLHILSLSRNGEEGRAKMGGRRIRGGEEVKLSFGGKGVGGGEEEELGEGENFVGYEKAVERMELILSSSFPSLLSLSRSLPLAQQLGGGGSRGMFVYGPSGVGKTIFCQMMGKRAEKQGILVEWYSVLSLVQNRQFSFPLPTRATLRFIDDGHLLILPNGNSIKEKILQTLHNPNLFTTLLYTSSSSPPPPPSSLPLLSPLCRNDRLSLSLSLSLPLPTTHQREKILLHLLKKEHYLPSSSSSPSSSPSLPLSPSEVRGLANRTSGYSGRDLLSLVQGGYSRCSSLSLSPSSSSSPASPSSGGPCLGDFERARREGGVGKGRGGGEGEIPFVSWEDVGASLQVRKSLEEYLLWPLLFPSSLQRFNLPCSSGGILLYGPGGVGKTLCAHAFLNSVANQVNFICVKASHLFSKYLGESEAAVRRLFERAREMSPCILFFDEFDSIGGRRSGGGYGDGNETDDGGGVRGRVVGQLLNEMDGVTVGSRGEKNREGEGKVFLLGCSSRIEAIDDAFLRPGRFGALVKVGVPGCDADRHEILKIQTRKMKLGDDVDLGLVAQQTRGWTGSDLAVLCREASLAALRKNSNAENINWEAFSSVMPSSSSSSPT